MILPFSPALQVDFAFVRNTDRSTQNLNAFIFGPAATVVRWDEMDLRDDGLLGNYDATGTLLEGKYQTSYSYLNKPIGGSLDEAYTKLHVKNALLSYWTDNSSSFWIESRNKIVHDAKGFKTNGASYPAAADFGDREVEVGDRIIVKGVDSNTDPFEVATYVQAIEGILTASSIDPASAGSLNQGTQTASESVAADPGNSGDITAVADGVNYTGIVTGHTTETYVVEVTQASTGGDLTTARLSVTSASGLDDVAVVQPAAVDTDFAIGTRGLVMQFNAGTVGDDLAVGEKWTVSVVEGFTAPTVTVSGTYGATDYVDRDYLVEVTTGGKLGSDPVIRVSPIFGNDISEQFTLTQASPGVSNTFNVGSHGIQFTFEGADSGLVKGDKWTISATAAKPGRMGKIVLGNNLPETVSLGEAAKAASAVEVELFIVSDVEIPEKAIAAGEVNWEARDTEFLVSAGIQLLTPLWTVNGEQVALPLKKPAAFSNDFSELYATYRFWHPSSNGIESLESTTTVSEIVPGTSHRDNPLFTALAKAGINSGGSVIHTYRVGDPTVLDNWDAALSASSNRLDTYGLVPLSQDQAVLDLVAAHIEQMNGPLVNKYRVGWFTGGVPTTSTVLSAASTNDALPVLATIKDDPDTTGTQYTYVELGSDNAGFVTAGVRSGDRLAIGFASNAYGEETFSEYIVDSVINESALLLKSGPSTPEAVARKIEIYRTLTPDERIDAASSDIEPYTLASGQVAAVGQSARYTGYRFRYLPVGNVRDGLYDIPGYHLAAAVAAMRSAAAPQQPLTRLPVSGFTSVPELEGFSKTQLDLLASKGGFLVTKNDVTGQLLIRHAITTGEFTDVNQREESIISTLHSSTFALVNVLEPLVGKSNVTDSLIALVRTELENTGSRLRSANFSPELGGQIVDFTILRVQPSPLFADGLVVDIEFELPAPANRISTTIFVTNAAA